MRATSLASLAALAVLLAPSPSRACSAPKVVAASRVSADDAGRRPWFQLHFPAGPSLTLRGCRNASCHGAAVPRERVGDYVRPAADLAPGSYQLSAAFGQRHHSLARFEITRATARTMTAPTTVHAVASRDAVRTACAPALTLTLGAPRDRDSLGPLVLLYDREPAPAHPLVGLIHLAPLIAGRAEIYRSPRDPLPPLWLPIGNDDGAIAARATPLP